MAGAPFLPPHTAPPAVTYEFFDEICETKTVIDIDPNKGELAWASAKTIVDHYVKKLRHIGDRCVEFAKKPMFDYM